MTEQVKIFQSDRRRLERKASRFIRTQSAAISTAVLRSYRQAGNVVDTVGQQMLVFEEFFADSLLAAHLSGRLRSMLSAVKAAKRIESETTILSTPYTDAIAFMKTRLKINEAELLTLKAKYGDAATHVTRNMTLHIERKMKLAVSYIVEENMHVREGMLQLRDTLKRAGVGTVNPWLLETLVRSQIQVGYSAGRWNSNQDPFIDKYLWGYDYVTVGDDRVRPTHEALDGTSLPKNHLLWNEIWPPNGFSCRCDVLEIWNDQKDLQKTKEPPDTVTIRGVEVRAGADEGWAVNHGTIYADMVSMGNL